MKFYRQGHSTYYAKYHLILTTKYRRKIFNEGMGEYLMKVIMRIQDYYPYLVIHEIKTDKDHAHILITIPPKVAVSRAVNILKVNTARAMKEKFREFLKKVYWGTDGIWADGYFVSTVGVNEAAVRKYIENQGREDSGQAQLEIG